MVLRLFIVDADAGEDCASVLPALLGRLGQMTGVRLAGGASAAAGFLANYLQALGLPWSPLPAWQSAPGNAGDLILAGGWQLPLWGSGTVPMIPWQAAPHGSLWAVASPMPGGMAVSAVRHDGRIAWICRRSPSSPSAIADAAAEALALAVAAIRDGVDAGARWAPAGDDRVVALGWAPWNAGGGS